MRSSAMVIVVVVVMAGAGGAESATPQAATTRAATLPAEFRAPTRVTLKLDHAPVVDALRSLFKQADMPDIDEVLSDAFAQQMADVTVTVNLVDQPFTVALVEICKQAYLEPQFSDVSGRGMTLMLRRPRGAMARPTSRPRIAATRPVGRGVVFRAPPRTGSRAGTTQPSWVDAPMVASGPFVVVAQGARRFSRIDFDSERGLDPIRTLELNLLVLRDPKLRLMAMADQLDVDEAVDDAGVSLQRDEAPAEPTQLRAIGGRETNPSRLRAILSYPPGETSKRIARLRGRLAATVITRTETVELVGDGKAIQPGVLRSAGDVRFTVTKAEPFGGQQGSMQITLTLPYAGGDDQNHWDEVRSLCSSDLMRATDANGKANYTIHSSVHSFRSDIGEYGLSIVIHPLRGPRNPNPPQLPVKVTWDVPIEVLDLSVPVELKDLPLP